jgi:hypothetical protein
MRKPPTWNGDILLGPPVGLGHAEQNVHPIGLASPSVQIVIAEWLCIAGNGR